MSLPPGFLDEIRARVSIARVLERKLSWDQRKSNAAKGDYWACCPFHQEKSASFHVDDRRGFYHCFGCQASGDAITFLREAENMGFMEAVEILAREAGLPMPERDPREAAKADRRAGLVEVMEEAARFFRLQLRAAKGQGARDYLRRRGLGEAAEERFGIGWAPDSRTALRDHLAAKGVPPKAMDVAGLVIQPEEGGAPFDRFRGRVMFPIRDPRGRCIAFGGRSLDPNARAKYLNSPETPLFDKGRTLYNHGPAREAAAKSGALIVAEGYMDVIALAEAGFAHVVAPLGTAITEEQLRLIWRTADEPVVALDGDRAGLAAAMRLIDLALPLLEPGRSLRFALLPEGMDPDDLIRAEGPGAMRAALDKAAPMVELLWRRETEGHVFDSPERRAALDARLRKALTKIAEPGLRGHYADALRERRARLFGQLAGSEPGFAPKFRTAKGRRGSRGFSAGAFDLPPAPTAETKASALVRAAGREAEARGREAALLLALVNHPALALDRLGALEDVEFLCRDLETLRRALISAADGLTPDVGLEAWRALLEARFGGPIDPLLSAGAGAGFAAASAPVTAAAVGFGETLARHAALIALVREVAEAEQEIGAGAGEDLDRRLEAVKRREFREAAPPFPESDDDEAHLLVGLEKIARSLSQGGRNGSRG